MGEIRLQNNHSRQNAIPTQTRALTHTHTHAPRSGMTPDRVAVLCKQLSYDNTMSAGDCRMDKINLLNSGSGNTLSQHSFPSRPVTPRGARKLFAGSFGSQASKFQSAHCKWLRLAQAIRSLGWSNPMKLDAPTSHIWTFAA